MRLVNAKYNLQIDMRENLADVLIVENAASMADMVSVLWKQCEGAEGDFVLSDHSVLDMKKEMDMVVNPFELSLNSKRIISKLYKDLTDAANEMVEEKAGLNAEIIRLLDRIIRTEPYSDIEYRLEFAWEDLFKFYGVRISEEYDSLVEKLAEYIKIMANLCGIKVICLVNIKSYLSSDELLDIYRYAEYNKVQLVLIESAERERLASENIYIIDKDNCLICG